MPEEFSDHVCDFNGEFQWDESTTRSAIVAATALPLKQLQARNLPAPTIAPFGAQGVTSQLQSRPAPYWTPRAPVAVEIFQRLQQGGPGVNEPAPPLYADNPFKPPPVNPIFRATGYLAPKVFGLDKTGDPFEGDLLLADPGAMDVTYEYFNHPAIPIPDENGQFGDGKYLDGQYGGGIDMMGALASKVVNYAGDQLVPSHHTQAPHKMLELDNGILGEGRPPVSPLPLSGPCFNANGPLPPFGTQAWALGYFPAGAMDQVAGLTVPTDSIALLNPDASSGEQCSELNLDGCKCDNPAVARCVDR
ncbi:unnamed protein product [Discula destructiva]